MKELAIAVVFGITGWMLKTWLNHRERMKELSTTRQGVGASEQRLERVEEAIHAIALEVERIGEGQRHVTMLLDTRAEQVRIPSSRS